MAASTYFDQVQQLYIAYFGRPADPVGLTYWATQVDAANGSVAAVIAGFSASSESNALYGDLPTAQKVSSIYLNLFNRLPEPAGLAYWVAQIESGAVSQAQMAYQIQSSAGPGDAAAVANKLAMAKAFTAQIDTSAEISGYSGAVAAAYGRAYLTSVDATPASVNSATANLASAVATATGVSATPVAPSTPTPVDTTYTLTTGADTLTGGGGNDTFSGTIDTSTPANSTFTLSDSLNGGAGIDTLSLTVTGATTGSWPAASLSSIERLLIRDQHINGSVSNYNLAGVAGLSTVASNVSSAAMMFSNLSTGTTVALLGDKASTLGNVSFSMSKASDAVSLLLDNGVKVASLTGSTQASTVTLTSSGAANQVDSITLGTTKTVGSLTINANSNLTTQLSSNSFASNATLTVTGAGTVNLGKTVAFSGSTVDASANSGGLTISMDGNAIRGFTGSSGNDQLLSSTALFAGVTIDGGAGTDTMSALLINTGNAAQFKNFEVLDLTGGTLNGGALDIATLSNSTFTGVQIAGDTVNNITLNNLHNTASGFNVNVTGYNVRATSLNFDNVSGASDVLNYDFNGASATYMSAGTVTSQGIETIKIKSGGIGVENRLSIVDDALQSISISGARDLILSLSGQGGSGASKLVSIDGQAATGTLNISLAAATASGGQSAVDIKSGSGNDRITVSTSNVSGSVGSTVTTGTGSDVIIVSNATVKGISGNAVQFTTITDFGVGDAIQFGSTLSFTSSKFIPVAPASLADALTQATVGRASNEAVWFTYGTDTYIVDNADGVSGFSAGDIVVKLSGTVDLSNSVSNVTSGYLTYRAI